MGSVYGPNFVTDGLVVLYDVGNVQSYPGSGTSLYPLGTVGYPTGTFSGDPTYSSANGGSLDLDGTDYVDTGITTELDFVHTAVYHEVWINYDAFGTATGAHASKRLYIGLLSADDFSWGIQDTNNWVLGSGYDHSIALGEWCMLSMTASGGTSRGYLNGVDTGQTKTYTAGTAYNPDGYWIGKWKHTSGVGIDGKIARTAIYNRVLTAAEILQNYNAHKSRFGL